MTIETAISINIYATFLLVLAYSYLYIQYHESYLAKWVMAWVIQLVRVAFLEKNFADQTSIIITILWVIMAFANGILIIAGTMDLQGKRLPKFCWAIAATALVLGCFGVLFQFPPQVFGIPGAFFIGSIYIWTGYVLWNTNVNGPGKYITASALILLGIHIYDLPFLVVVEWFVPWGVMIDGLFKAFIALGIVFLYFEKVRNELEKYYRLLAENTTDVIYRYRLVDPRGFEYVSPAVRQLTGYEPRHFKNIRQVLQIIHTDDRWKFKEFFKNLGSASGLSTIRVRHKTGEMVWGEQKYSIVYGTDGQALAVEGIIRDVTKRVMLEQDVSRLDRLNIAGQMAANLAHEVRNPLTTVRGYIQMLGSKQEFETYKERFDMLLGELDRTNQIITEYLSLSKNKTVDMKKCNINDIIMSLYPLIQGDAVTSKVEVVLELGEVKKLFLDDKEIKQLVLNLTRNAIEAMTDGGRLGIRTAASGEEIMLTVIDQGKGIPEHVLNNLGKPFLTTKDHGTGLGMAMCYRIAERHNAKLDIETGPAGTTVHAKFRRS